MNWLRISTLLLLAALTRAAQAQPQLDDARLRAVAPELRVLFAQAAQDSVPDELLADKLREGLAKGVAPARVVRVLQTLEQSLARARVEAAAAGRTTPGKELLKAIVDAHAAGVAAGELKQLLRPPAPARPVELLTDLALRGYPPVATARLVAEVAARDEAALERLPGLLERARVDAGLSAIEAVDALIRAGAEGAPLDRALPALRHDHATSDDLRGPPRDTTGARGPAGPHGNNGNGKGPGH